MIKAAFFDVDGLLSAPVYPTAIGADTMGIGMAEKEWLRYCILKGEDGYEHCRPVPCVRRYARALKESGCALYVLTASGSTPESIAKQKFIRIHYPDLFDEFFAVPAKEDKIPFMEEFGAVNGLEAGEMELVEDTYSTLLDASSAGFKCTHLSNIAASEP